MLPRAGRKAKHLPHFSDSSSCKLHPEGTDKNRTRKGLQLHPKADQAWQTWSASLMKVSDWAHAFRPRRPCTSTPASRCQPVLLLPLAGASCGLMRAIIRRPVFKFANLFRENNCMNMAWPFSGAETTVCSHSRSRAILVQHSRRSAVHGYRHCHVPRGLPIQPFQPLPAWSVTSVRPGVVEHTLSSTLMHATRACLGYSSHLSFKDHLGPNLQSTSFSARHPLATTVES